MMQNSKYTVLMSVYYKEKPEYLSLSIESMLNQTVKPDEFIIVKDGPLTTELDEVINNFVTAYPKTFNIIVNETNLGLGPALAKGIENSKNELIARMDSDDYVVSTRCERQLEKFREDPKLGMVGSYEAEFVDDIDNVISIHRVPSENDEIERFMHRRCSVLHPTVMYKKSAVLKSGNYQSVLLYEDYDLFARMVLEYHIKSYNNKGVSLVLVNNEKADSIFENVKIELKWKSTRIEDSMQPPLKAPFPKPEGREQFWNDVNDKSFSYIARAYGDNGTANYIKKVLRRAKRKIQHLISKT